jgi:hypothetical protein
MSDQKLAQQIIDYIDQYNARSSVQVAFIRFMCEEALYGEQA